MDSYSKLNWRCRRGTKELDFLLNKFLEKKYQYLTAEEKDAFSELLDVQDPMIMDWILNRNTPPTKTMDQVVEKIRGCAIAT